MVLSQFLIGFMKICHYWLFITWCRCTVVYSGPRRPGTLWC